MAASPFVLIIPSTLSWGCVELYPSYGKWLTGNWWWQNQLKSVLHLILVIVNNIILFEQTVASDQINSFHCFYQFTPATVTKWVLLKNSWESFEDGKVAKSVDLIYLSVIGSFIIHKKFERIPYYILEYKLID